ncbi:unnamed protein product [Prorocentrum cordatum]|uniref:Uncharacterized protein n=1 Tax=Prorocentrum cordatum TaxID=2364126 RepID=A0ABN9PJ54_9DINO|nr:unnamed protein product [Polarella glacialis]
MPGTAKRARCTMRLRRPARAAAAAQLAAVAASQATYPSEFRFGWCVGSQCFDHTLSAAHFQLRVQRYYGEGRRPPLREAFYVATLPLAYQRELLFGCPGLVVFAYLLLAEARLFTHPPVEAAELFSRALSLLEMPEIAGPHMHNLQHSWPLQAAMDRYNSTAQRSRDAAQSPMSLDIVIPHCGEDASWLADRAAIEMLPRHTRVFLYEKCGMSKQAILHFAMLTELLQGQATVIQKQLDDAVDPRTGLPSRRDECTAYLTHVVEHYDDPWLADVTLFLHGDPSDHTPMGLLNVLLRGLALGTLRSVEFLHLGAPRMVHTSNLCQEGIFEMAMRRKPRLPLSTYCCAQFAVARARLRARPREEYERMLRIVDGTVADGCTRIGPAYERYEGQRLSHCYFFEFMWHVVFGEPEDLPLRADDAGLPVVFRLKDNEDALPSTWGSYMAPYVGGQATFGRHGHELWLQGIRDAPGIGAGKQMHFGDMVPKR